MTPTQEESMTESSMTFCLMKLSQHRKQAGGLTNPELEPYASQQNDFVIPPELDTRSISSKYNPSHG